MNPELPFTLRGGNSQMTAIHNRMEAIERIKFLCGVDLRQKSAYFLKALDLEMWKRWYINEPANKPIDEDFCQRSAEVIRAMVGNPVVIDNDTYNKEKAVHTAKLEEQANVSKEPESDTENARKTSQPITD